MLGYTSFKRNGPEVDQRTREIEEAKERTRWRDEQQRLREIAEREAGKHEPSESFAVCVNNEGYETSLELRKIYQLLSLHLLKDGQRRLRVIDESGEDNLYPAGMFVELELPPKARDAFSPVD